MVVGLVVAVVVSVASATPYTTINSELWLGYSKHLSA